MSPDSDDGQPRLADPEPEGRPAPEAEPRAERPNFLTATRFTDFDLPPEIMTGVDQAGFEYCTPIQAQAIPVALKGLDIAGQAQTGTGKTTAFLIPLMHRLLKNKPLEPGVPRAIIITPTRELALQIHEDALILGGATNLRQALVIGGIEYREQAELLGTAPEIVICTPGRIIDYLQQGVFKTKGVEVAVVDEADRLLDMGFIKDLKYLLGKLPSFSQRQTMLFSATLDERVLELTYQFMNPPQFITAEPDKTTKLKIEQELYHVGREEKLSLLIGLLRREPHRRVMIFANTKSGVDWLAKKLLGNGFHAEGITGDLPQPKRLKLMEAFKENRLQILVATDVASRGIHVEDVSHIYNYDLPQDAENYVHRIGRTARCGREGKAVSFGCEDYVFHLEAIENLLGEKIPVFWADNEWFQTDSGGEVRLKERGGRKTLGRPERGGGRGAGRPAARSQRPGGIFGLAPLLAGDQGEDERRHLVWAVAEETEIAPEPEEEAAMEEGGREGRRRRRRRGRRGREAPADQLKAEPSFPVEPPRIEPGLAPPALAEPTRAEAPALKTAPRKSRRSRQPESPAAAEAVQAIPPERSAPVRGRRKSASGPAEPAALAEGTPTPPVSTGRKGRRKTAEPSREEAASPQARPPKIKPEAPASENVKPKRTRRPAASGGRKPKAAPEAPAAPDVAEK